MAAINEVQDHDGDTEKAEFGATFFDLDNLPDLNRLVERSQDSATANYVVDFNETRAVCAFDVSVESIADILGPPTADKSSTRWINLWSPFHQQPLLELIANRYGLTPRLLALMCSNPHEARHVTATPANRENLTKPFWYPHTLVEDKQDVEKGSNLDEPSDDDSIPAADSALHGNLYRIVASIWHYCSVDFGQKYICIGYNSLYRADRADDDSEHSPLSNCIRVWTWLLLCEGNTVVSITENPFPATPGTQLSTRQQRILTETRRNLTNVFRSLSSASASPLTTSNPLKLLPIRQGLNTPSDGTSSPKSDSPSLLFYYLFENWQNGYTFATRRESRFGVELAGLRAEMFTRPRLRHIDRLDHIGKELNVLRRHFAAHKRIIDRVSETRANVVGAGLGSGVAGLPALHVVSEVSSHHAHGAVVDEDDVRSALVLTAHPEAGPGAVTLAPAARARFRRLRDLIDVYALSEVEELLKQKEALISMNFNLIAIKQSVDVERLTRITLLLTKVTILFTPISLMTAYFSVQLKDVTFTVPMYWISFAIVFVLSWLALLVLGVFSGSVQTFEVLRGTWAGLRQIYRYTTDR